MSLSFFSAAHNVIGFYLASPHVRIMPLKGNLVYTTRSINDSITTAVLILPPLQRRRRWHVEACASCHLRGDTHRGPRAESAARQSPTATIMSQTRARSGACTRPSDISEIGEGEPCFSLLFCTGFPCFCVVLFLVLAFLVRIDFLLFLFILVLCFLLCSCVLALLLELRYDRCTYDRCTYDRCTSYCGFDFYIFYSIVALLCDCCLACCMFAVWCCMMPS